MAEVDLVAQDVDVNQLPNVLLALVRRQRRITPIGRQLVIPRVELFPYLGQLDLDPVRFLLLALGVSQVRDEIIQPPRLT